MAEIRIVIDPTQMTPEAAAAWTVAFEREVALLRAPLPVPGHAPGDDPVVEAQRVTWARRTRSATPYRDRFLGEAAELGYTLRPARSETPRSYLHLVRADGVVAGYVNSRTFTFVGAQLSAPTGLPRRSGYPAIEFASDLAVDMGIAGLKRFAEEVADDDAGTVVS